MRVSVVSFNLAQHQAPPLALLAQAATAAPFDVLAVAVQELAPFAEQMRRSHAKRLSPAMRRVVAAFDAELPGDDTVRLAVALEHGAVGLAVWVRLSVCSSHVNSCAKVGLGPLGLSSKAAVAVALHLCPAATTTTTTVAFVSAHLPAGATPAANAARNQAFRSVAARLVLRARSLFDCDAVFFAGDLNYRAGPNPSFADTDELSRAIRCNAAFPAFSEPAVSFAPTYKLTNERTYHPRRQPAWCDRILTYSRHSPAASRHIVAWLAATAAAARPPAPGNDDTAPNSIHCLRYWSLPIAGSDHLPVFAYFRVDLSHMLSHSSCADIPPVADPLLRTYYHILGLSADRLLGFAHLALTDPTSAALLALTMAVLFALARSYCIC
ncbi:hypothetical protein GGI20_004372 [Coemansia sp. BCRC 34301]|nr:hypothetical protein GGI20_004372 [Coemansia sp. BCRC 34301]